MIARLKYSTNTHKLTEYVIPWGDVWNGEYRRIFEPIYYEHKTEWRVNEYRDGIVLLLDKDLDNEIAVAVYPANCPKSKVKISEVFKELCQNE